MIESIVTSSMGAVLTKRPSRMIVTRWQIEKTSSRRCEMNSTAASSARSARTTSKRRSTSTDVSAAVGSSITMTLALNEMALAISTICWSATERPRAGRAGSSSTPSRVNTALASARIWARSMTRPAPTGWRPMKMFSATLRSGKRVGSW